MSIILKAENISKQYRLGTVGTGTISDDLKRWWYNVRGLEDPFLKVGSVNNRSAKATEDYVWALRDINFEVKTGEILGIIGKNGAGKTTLLKILSRVTSPTTGSIKTKGRIASLLEVGTGFHGELTGRENIFMNGAVLGMSKSEIKRKLDEIIDFSGCEMYIDTPVKRYSSGMTVRLGFAVAAHLEPEILVVDEVLAVGDADFQKKAIGKMQNLSHGEGRTVLFVSHNMASVKSLCDKGIVLENGCSVFAGGSEDAIDFYLNHEINEVGAGEMEFFYEKSVIKELQILSVITLDQTNRVRSTFMQSENIIVRIKFKLNNDLSGMRFNLTVKNTSEVVVFATSSHEITKNEISKGIYKLELTIPAFLLNKFRYILMLNAGIPGNRILVEPIDVLFIDIEGDNSNGSMFIEKWPGMVSPKIEWNFV